MKAPRHSHWHHRQVGGMKVSVRPKPKTPYTILHVESVIDTGRGRRKVLLKNALPDFLEVDLKVPKEKEHKVRLPRYIDDLDLVYLDRGFGVVANVTESLQAIVPRAKLAAVVPEVIRPGDFMLYRHGREGMRYAGVIRAVSASRVRDTKEEVLQ